MGQALPAWLENPPAALEEYSEAAFHHRWLDLYSAIGAGNPHRLALAAGQLTDRFAGVFVAGYQAALRSTFSDAELPGWGCLAVSEDRSAEDPLPGVTFTEGAEGFRLNGYKTWIAQVAHVDVLVVQARHAESGARRIFVVAKDALGLSLNSYPEPKMLPDLSQGRAHFDEVLVPTAAPVSALQMRSFADAEALCIFGAFLGMAQRLCLPDDQLSLQWTDLVAQFLRIKLHPSADGVADDARRATLQDFNRGIQALLISIVQAQPQQHLARDQGLVKMYSRRFTTV